MPLLLLSLPQLNLSSNRLGPEGANALAESLKVNASLTSVNLLRNGLDTESANSLASVAKGKGVSLCGISHDQTEANFNNVGLTPIDAILVANDLCVRTSLTEVLAFTQN